MTNTPIKTKVIEDVAVIVFHDPCPQAPTNDGEVFIQTSMNKHFELAHRQFEHERYHVYPLYAYIHSGVTLSLTPFSCPWDSGQIGVVAVNKISDNPKEEAEWYVNEWNSYLNGERYGYKILEGDEVVESCWDFQSVDYCFEDGVEVATRLLMDRHACERMMAS